MAEVKRDERSRPQALDADNEYKEPLQIQILEKRSQPMAAASGFIAAFKWNEAMKKVISDVWGDPQSEGRPGTRPPTQRRLAFRT